MDELSMSAKTMPLGQIIDVLTTEADYGDKPAEDLEAFAAAAAILQTLQEAGAADAEQVKDLLHDYNGLAKQYQGLHDRFEVPRKPAHADGVWHCPRCNKRVGFNNTHCHWCGQKIKWG